MYEDSTMCTDMDIFSVVFCEINLKERKRMQTGRLQKLHAVAWVATEKKKEKRKVPQREGERQISRAKKRGREREVKKLDKDSANISHQSWAEVFLPLFSLCPSFLRVKDFP